MKEKLYAWLRTDFGQTDGEIRNRFGGLVMKCEDVDDYIDYICGKLPLEKYSELEVVYDALELSSVLAFGEWLDEVFEKVVYSEL